MLLPDLVSKLQEFCGRVNNNRGGIAIISGESGIGKSFAARQFTEGAEELGFAVLIARCRPQTEDPLYPIYEALGHFLRHSSLNETQLRELLLEYAFALPRLTSLIKPLLHNDPYLRGLDTLASRPASSNAPMYPVFLDLLRRLASGRPIIFLIDDLQWVDRETISFLMYVTSEASIHPIVWLTCLNTRKRGAITRASLDEFVSYANSTLDESCLSLELSRYSRDQIAALISTILGLPAKIPENMLGELYERSQGVPYVLKTFLDVLRREGSLVEANGEFILKDSLRLKTLPDSLRSAIAKRIEVTYKVFPESRNVLETAAVLGERFEDSDLDSLLEMCNTYRLLLLIEDNYALVRSLLEERQWQFEHVTVRDFVYQTLGDRAIKLHRMIADHLIASGSEDYGKIAYHCKQAGDHEAYIGYQLLQVEAWLQQGFFLQSNLLLSNLWKHPFFFDNPNFLARQFEIEFTRTLLQFYLSEYDTCLQMLYHLTSKFPEKSSDPSIILLKAKCRNKGRSRADFTAARDMLESALTRTEIKSSPYFHGRMQAELVVSYAHLNEFAKSREAFSRAEQLLNPYESPIELAQLMRRSLIFFEPELSEKLLLRAIEIFRRHHIDHEVVRTTNNLATLYMSLGNLDKASEQLQNAIALNSRLGNFAGDYLINNLALITLAKGSPERALEALRDAEACARRPVCKLIIRVNQAAALLKVLQAEAAVDLLQSLLTEALEIGEEIYLATIRFNLVMAFLMLGHLREALFQLARCRTDRLLALGSYYGEHHRGLLLQILSALGAVRAKFEPEAINLEPSCIDMQFWGD